MTQKEADLEIHKRILKRAISNLPKDIVVELLDNWLEKQNKTIIDNNRLDLLENSFLNHPG